MKFLQHNLAIGQRRRTQRSVDGLSLETVATEPVVDRVAFQPRWGLAEGVSSITRPAIESRIAYHLRPHRVHLNVAHAGQPILLVLDWNGTITTVEQRANPFVLSIEI